MALILNVVNEAFIKYQFGNLQAKWTKLSGNIDWEPVIDTQLSFCDGFHLF